MEATALDRLLDYAYDQGGTITWGRKGKHHIVTLTGTCFCEKCGPEGAPYNRTAIGDTREKAAEAMLGFAAGE